jgi:hypothetical protein
MEVPATLSVILFSIKVLSPHYIMCPNGNLPKLTTVNEVIFTKTSLYNITLNVPEETKEEEEE